MSHISSQLRNGKLWATRQLQRDCDDSVFLPFKSFESVSPPHAYRASHTIILRTSQNFLIFESFNVLTLVNLIKLLSTHTNKLTFYFNYTVDSSELIFKEACQSQGL